MIQIYADGVLTYDSRLEEYDLAGLKINTGLNKGGTAEIVMPPNHPKYDSYVGFRTIVEIYRDGVLRFRGRALYQIDDYDNLRTVVCEGELCFLQDSVSRPYLYETDPATIFKAIVTEYNGQVDDFKQFKVGDVEVTDPNNYIRLESEDAETVFATLNTLLDRCGGYIVFTSDATSARVINWYPVVGNTNTQTIDGENLLSFSRSGASGEMVTAIIPYGAKDETTGARVTIESVNDGSDTIDKPETAAIYGRITKSVTWDDVSEPSNLKRKAEDYLNTFESPVTSLTLTALDLSYLDKDIESFKLGDRIRVISSAHRVNTEFQLVETTEDLLNPANNVITLGKELRTLTGLDVAGDSKSQSAVRRAVSTVKSDTKSGLESVSQQVNEKLQDYAKTSTLEDYAKTSTLNEVIEGLTEAIEGLTERIAALEAAAQ